MVAIDPFIISSAGLAKADLRNWRAHATGIGPGTEAAAAAGHHRSVHRNGSIRGWRAGPEYGAANTPVDCHRRGAAQRRVPYRRAPPAADPGGQPDRRTADAPGQWRDRYPADRTRRQAREAPVDCPRELRACRPEWNSDTLRANSRRPLAPLGTNGQRAGDASLVPARCAAPPDRRIDWSLQDHGRDDGRVRAPRDDCARLVEQSRACE